MGERMEMKTEIIEGVLTKLNIKATYADIWYEYEEEGWEERGEQELELQITYDPKFRLWILGDPDDPENRIYIKTSEELLRILEEIAYDIRSPHFVLGHLSGHVDIDAYDLWRIWQVFNQPTNHKDVLVLENWDPDSPSEYHLVADRVFDEKCQQDLLSYAQRERYVFDYSELSRQQLKYIQQLPTDGSLKLSDIVKKLAEERRMYDEI